APRRPTPLHDALPISGPAHPAAPGAHQHVPSSALRSWSSFQIGSCSTEHSSPGKHRNPERVRPLHEGMPSFLHTSAMVTNNDRRDLLPPTPGPVPGPAVNREEKIIGKHRSPSAPTAQDTEKALVALCSGQAFPLCARI